MRRPRRRLDKVLHSDQATDPLREVELSVFFLAGQFNATGNFWGVFPNVADRIQEFTVGTIDFTNFKSVEIGGTGPQ